MTLREFIDEEGSTWRVWDTRPSSGRVLAEFAVGWLTFERGVVGFALPEEGKERRRLTPIPEGWNALPDDRLCKLYSSAKPVQASRREPNRR